MSALNEEINERRYFEVKEWLAETPEEREYKKKIEKCSAICDVYAKKLGFSDIDSCIEKCIRTKYVTLVLKDVDGNVIKRLSVPSFALEAARKIPYEPIPVYYERIGSGWREYNIVWEPNMGSDWFKLYIVEHRREGIAAIERGEGQHS